MDTHRESVGRVERNMIVRVPTGLYKRLQEIAETEQRSLSGEVRWLMERRVAEVDSAAAEELAA